MNPTKRKAVLPGSYDPITKGHLDVITRAADMFDEVVVGVVNVQIRKSKALFTAEERCEMVERATEHLANVSVEPRSRRSSSISRTSKAPARSSRDYGRSPTSSYEFEMNQLNRRQAPDIESRLPDGLAAVQFPLVERRQGAGDVRRGYRRSCAARHRRAVEGSAGALTKESRAMDVLVLIDKLDDLVHNAKPVPLTDQVRVDKEEIYDILDQMRATIPEEIKQARWIVKERQEMLAEAKREAERIVKEARERQQRLVCQEEITKQAERAAEDIIEDARAREREIRLGAEDYADEILNTLEVNLSKFIAAVQRGRERLAGREEPAEVG